MSSMLTRTADCRCCSTGIASHTIAMSISTRILSYRRGYTRANKTRSGPERRMKFLPLIWSGIWRKPGRTILIFLQVSVAFALFGVLQGLKTGVQHAVDAARADLLIVHSRLSLIMEGLPISLLGPIRSVPGVRVAIPVELFVC